MRAPLHTPHTHTINSKYHAIMKYACKAGAIYQDRFYTEQPSAASSGGPGARETQHESGGMVNRNTRHLNVLCVRIQIATEY